MPANKTRREFQEVPFRPRRFKHIAGINAGPIKDQRQFIHQRNVQITLGVFNHLGGLGGLDGWRLVDACRDNAAIDISDDIKGCLILARNHLGDGGKAVFTVARINAFGRIANRKISPGFQARQFFKDRHAFFFGGTGINRAFINNDVALFQNGANGFRC